MSTLNLYFPYGFAEDLLSTDSFDMNMTQYAILLGLPFGTGCIGWLVMTSFCQTFSINTLLLFWHINQALCLFFWVLAAKIENVVNNFFLY